MKLPHQYHIAHCIETVLLAPLILNVKLNTLLNFKITFIIREWKTHYQFSFRFFIELLSFRLESFYSVFCFCCFIGCDRCFMLDVNKQLHSRFLQFLYLYGLQEGEL